MEVEIQGKSVKGQLVQITINSNSFQVLEGQTSVASIKQLAGIAAGYELEEVRNGKLVPLQDNAHVHIKGGEQFVSHPRDGGSS